MISTIKESANPAQELQQYLQDGEPRVFVFQHEQDYLPGKPAIRLLVILLPAATAAGSEHRVMISDQVEMAREKLSGTSLDEQTLILLADDLRAPILLLSGANRLVPVDIAKPWGKEVWYTGIEARGQSLVSDGKNQVPLPWLLALDPELILNTRGKQVNLLKILDPLPEEVFGDLYFELHEEKQEVYVVTNVDRRAWPDGSGAIRFGFDQDVRKRYGDDAKFRKAYLDAVASYSEVRREVDRILDRCRLQSGVELNAPVDMDTLKGWLATVPVALREREESRRQAMNAFTAMLPLQVGDVVKVPCLTPHALQHGVRTIEFQTPVYERKILSFAQKVLTQGHWDTEEAAELMEIGPPELTGLIILEQAPGLLREQVVRFDDFLVQRLTLAPGCSWQVAANSLYRLLITVNGQCQAGHLVLQPEEAALIPACASAQTLCNEGDTDAVLLIAEPF